MKFKPLHDRVVVKRLETDEKTTGGIIIPDTAKEKPQEGEVVAIGPGSKNENGKILKESLVLSLLKPPIQPFLMKKILIK